MSLPLALASLTQRQDWVIAMGKFIYRGLIFICGFRIEVIGRPLATHPILYVANHCSYFDIVVLGSILNANFVAKKEVASWPMIGPMAKYLAGTVFVERRARHSKTQADLMSDRLSIRKESLILFPEGTSGDGRSVLPFKSALFSVAEMAAGRGNDLPVQPISLAYTRLDGLPLGRAWRSHFAWYGDMDLASHIWVALGIGRATVTVIFHPSVNLREIGSRKALAEHCHSVVKRGVMAANSGRLEAYQPEAA